MSADIREQYDKIYRYCYFKVKNSVLAEDLTQQTFLKYFSQNSYIDRGRPMAYLYTIARNLCVDSFRAIEGEPFESNYDDMVKDREYARKLSGRAIDADLLMEAAAAYATIPEDAKVYQATDSYQQNTRPYSEIYGIARRIYNTSTNRFGAENMGTLSQEQAEQFYSLRTEQIEQEVKSTLMSDIA